MDIACGAAADDWLKAQGGHCADLLGAMNYRTSFI